MTVPFDYPTQPHERRHGPRGYADYGSYRPWLRDEFEFRCVYCLMRERWGIVRGVFNLDHFQPVAIHPTLTLAYENLVYTCARCNSMKGVQEVPNPCRVLLADAVILHADGRLEGTTLEAVTLIRKIQLNDPEYIEFRQLWIRILDVARQHAPDLYRLLLSYPEELPDLSMLIPPGGNARLGGIEESCHARRERGQLPGTY